MEEKCFDGSPKYTVVRMKCINALTDPEGYLRSIEKHEREKKMEESYVAEQEKKLIIDRRRLGTHAVWYANPLRRLFMFVAQNFFKSYKLEIKFWGRGPRNINGRRYHQTLPLQYAKKVSIYVTLRRR